MKLPPYAELLGIVEDPGRPGLLVMPFSQSVVGRPDFVQGGALGGLLEMAAIVALKHSLADQAARIKPINITVDYMRGGRGKPTYAQADVTRLGNRIANVESTAWQDDRARPIAAARLNFLITRG